MSASENGHTRGYTPGPWEVHEAATSADHPDYGAIYIIGANLGGLVRASLPWATEMDNGDFGRVQANARLIAAAPEMHKTGRKLANEIGGLKAFEHEVRAIIGNTNWSVLMQRLAEADAVLSKAEGRQP
jgi:hypothetical protein